MVSMRALSTRTGSILSLTVACTLGAFLGLQNPSPIQGQGSGSGDSIDGSSCRETQCVSFFG